MKAGGPVILEHRVVYGDVRFVRLFVEAPWRWGVKQECGDWNRLTRCFFALAELLVFSQHHLSAAAMTSLAYV